ERRDPEHEPVGAVRDEVLLEEEPHAVREGLEDAERPRPVGPEPVLHVGDDLALEPDHQDDGDEQAAEPDEDLQQDDEDVLEADAALEERVVHHGGEHQPTSTRTSQTAWSAPTSTPAST